MTCVNKAEWRLAIRVMERIKQPAASDPSNMSHRRSSGLIRWTIRNAIMPLNNLFRNLFAAYACAASGCAAGESEA